MKAASGSLTSATPLLRALLFCAALAALAPAARAQFNVTGQAMGGDDAAASQWIRIQTESDLNDPVPIRFQLSSMGMKGTQNLSLPKTVFQPHAKRMIDVAMPQHGYISLTWPNPLTGSPEHIGLQGYDQSIFLNVCPPQAQATEAQIQDFAKPFSRSHNVVRQIAPSDFPRHWKCLLAFRVVMMSEADYNALEPESKETLARYVNAGGSLALYQSSLLGETPNMLGRVQRIDANPILSQESYAFFNQTPLNRDALNQLDQNFPVKPPQTSGAAGGLTLATLFFILAGPVCLFIAKRRKNPHLMLKAVPALSAGFCVIMIAYFILSQGFQNRGGSVSLHILDEANHRGETFAHHMLLSGLYPHGGFTFPAEAALLPHVQKENPFEIQLDEDGTQHLTSGWLVPRVPFYFSVMLPFESRERLLLDGRKNARNAFEVDIEAGALILPGQAFAIPKLRIGQSGALAALPSATPLDAQLGRFLSPEERVFVNQALSGMLPGLEKTANSGRGFYVVRLASPWGVSTSGVAIQGPQTNLLIGLLPGGAVESNPEAAHAAGA